MLSYCVGCRACISTRILIVGFGCKNLVFNLWRGRPRSPIVFAQPLGKCLGLPHFHSTLNTVKICVCMYNSMLFMGTNRTFVCVPPYMHVQPLANLARGFSACAWPCRAKQLWYVLAPLEAFHVHVVLVFLCFCFWGRVRSASPR